VLPLRYPWVWMTFGWALVAAVVIGSLTPGDLARSLSIHDKLMHAGSYFLLMIWFAGLYRRSRHLAIALVLFCLGTVLDMLQAGTATRHFDLRDVLANASGILLGLVMSYWLLEGWCQSLERRLIAAGG
jgi:VanZ family protein